MSNARNLANLLGTGATITSAKLDTKTTATAAADDATALSIALG